MLVTVIKTCTVLIMKEPLRRRKTNSERNIIEIQPTKPSVCFKGFVDLSVTNDYDTTCITNKHNISPKNSSHVCEFTTYVNLR